MLRAATAILLTLLCATAQAVAPDLTAYDPACGVALGNDGERLTCRWTAGEQAFAVAFDTSGKGPLIASLTAGSGENLRPIATGVRPQFVVTTGSRKRNAVDRHVFFDKPASRETKRHVAALDLKSVRVRSEGRRVTVSFGALTAGPFSGELVVNLYAGSPLVRIDAQLKSNVEAATGLVQPDGAYIYDFVLEGGFTSVAYIGLDDKLQRVPLKGEYTPIAVRHRTTIGIRENGAGCVAVFPPPHSFFFPRDRTDNFKFAQIGQAGFGIRQDPAGGGAFVPWFDAPPGKVQRMDAFLLLSSTPPAETLELVKRYTHGDTFKPMEGYRTFTSHYHSRLAVGEMAGKPVTAEFARVMKAMNVNIVHLAEFHGDGHWNDPGPLRLPEMKAMFDLCRKHSDESFLLLPGEEGIRFLAHPWPPEKAIHPGHWMYLFPKPVYLTWTRAEGQPFKEEIDGYGTVYHVGHRDDMVRLLEEEKGMAWSTHPRIKASFATPDAFKDQPWYKGEHFLGAAWKAMPADLSHDRLGLRCLGLLDDMNNWGQRKMLPAEVDVFEIDRTHELYGHMNINYLRLPELPKPDNWQPVLDVLRKGDFFCTTGEVLIHGFEVRDGKAGFELEWTFPLQFAEVIWSDGRTVHRERLDLTTTGEFGRQRFELPAKMKDAKWYRLEAWDIARNGAYTQPVWID